MEMSMTVDVRAPHSGKMAEEHHMFMVELRMMLADGKQLGAKRMYIAGDF